MNRATKFCLLVILAGIAAGCGGPEMSSKAMAVRSVTNADGCRFIESNYLESRPQFVQDYVKRNVSNVGGNAYKIVSTNEDMAVGVQIAQVNYEAYFCDNL